MAGGSAIVGILRAILTTNTAEFRTAMGQASAAAAGFSRDMNKIGAQSTQVGLALTKSLTLPILAIGVGAAKAAIDFESSFAGVRKTVEATEAEFAGLAQQFRDMAKEIPVNVNELNRIGEAAGALGIKKEDIEEFTRVMAQLGVTTNLTSDQAANAVARIQNIFGAAGKETDRLASTLVALGNAGASTEDEIVEMGLRIAGAGHTIGLTQAQVLSFASTLASVGIKAEAGGSAISRVFLKMNNAVMDGGKGLDEFARVAGVSAASFKKSFETDAAGAMVAFVNGLARMKAEGKNINQTIEGLVGKNIILKDTLFRLAGAGDLLAEQLKLGNQAWEDNTALTIEAEKRFATTASQLQLLWNRISDVAITLGNAMLPAIQSAIGLFNTFIPVLDSVAKMFAAMPGGLQLVVLGFFGLLAAIGPVLFIFGQLVLSAGLVAKAFTTQGLATRALTLATTGLSTALITLSRAISVVGAAIAGWQIGKFIGEMKAGALSITEWAEALMVWRLGTSGVSLENIKLSITSRRLLEALKAQEGATDDVGESLDEVTIYAEDFAGATDDDTEATKAFKKALDATAAALAKFRGTDTVRELQAMRTAWTKLTSEEQANSRIIARVIEDYEKIRDQLDKLPASLEAVRSEFQKPLRSNNFFENSVQVMAAARVELQTFVHDGLIPATSQLDLFGTAAGPKLITGIKTGTVVTQAWSDNLSELARSFSQLAEVSGDSFGGVLKDIAELIATLDIATQAGKGMKVGLDDMGAAFEDGGGGAAQFAAGLTNLAANALAAAAAIGAATDKATKSARVMGGAMTGAQIGASMAGGWGALVGLGVGALVGALRNPKWADIMRTTGSEWGAAISEGLAREIAKTDDLMHGRGRVAASLMHIADLFEEMGGVAEIGLGKAIAKTRDLFVMLETGKLAVNEVEKAFNSVFAELAANMDVFTVSDKDFASFRELIHLATTAGVEIEGIADIMEGQFASAFEKVIGPGGLVPKGFQDMIAKAQKAGIGIKAIAEFLRGQATGVIEGLKAFADGAVASTAGSAKAMGLSVVAAFDTLIANGVSFTEAIKQITPAIQSMRTMLTEAGFSGGAAFNQLGALVTIASDKIKGPMIDAVLGLNQVFTGLHNTGMLTQEMFTGLSTEVGATFNKLVKGGVSGNQAMRLMQPTLQTLWELTTDHGFAVDETTQKILDEAEAQGIVGAAFRSAEEKMVRAMENIGLLLEDLIELFASQLPTAIENVPDVDIDVNVDRTAFDDFNRDVRDRTVTVTTRTRTEGGGERGFAGGTGLRFLDFGAGEPVRLHGHEAVVRADETDSLAAQVAAHLGPMLGSSGGTAVIEVQVYLEGATVADKVSATWARGGARQTRAREALLVP